MEFRKMVTITLYTRQQKRHWCIEQSYGLCGRGRSKILLREKLSGHSFSFFSNVSGCTCAVIVSDYGVIWDEFGNSRWKPILQLQHFMCLFLWFTYGWVSSCQYLVPEHYCSRFFDFFSFLPAFLSLATDHCCWLGFLKQALLLLKNLLCPCPASVFFPSSYLHLFSALGM